MTVVSLFDARRSAAQAAGAPPRVPPAMPRDWPHRDASAQVLADGMNWHVQTMGAGPRLLLLHGTAASTHTWRDLMPRLAEDYEVLAVDLPGHGFSERRGDNSMRLADIASSLDSLLRALAFQPCYAVGHSAGAAIILRMALDGSMRPDAVVGLNAALLPFGGSLRALFAPMAKLFSSTRLIPRLVARRAREAAAVRRVLQGTGSDIDAEGVRLYQRLLQNEAHVAAVLEMMANWQLKGLLEELADLSADLQLVCGLNDQAVSPQEANAVLGVLPATEVVRLENCGHLAHEEQPATVADLIRCACGHRERPGHA